MKKPEPEAPAYDAPRWVPLRAADYDALVQFVQRVQALTRFVRRVLDEVEPPSSDHPRGRRRKRRKRPLD